MSFISNSVFGRSYADYHNLYAGNIESENYEIVKLINGEIDAVFYSNEAHMLLVMAGGYIWKINARGELVDTLHGTGQLYNSGILLRNTYNYTVPEELRYIDWIYTGEKREKIFPLKIDGNDFSNAELAEYLNKAEVVEFITGYSSDSKRYGIALLKTRDHWEVLDISSHKNNIDESCWEFTNKNKDIWQETCLQGYKKREPIKLQPLQDILPYSKEFNILSEPLSLQKFSRGLYYFDEGFTGWLGYNILGRTVYSGYPGELPESYWYGDGYFQLKHESEVLKFKAFVASRDGHINFDNISIFSMPDSEDVKIIDISYIEGEHNYLDKEESLVKYHKKEVGLYIVRKKSTVNKSRKTASVANSQYHLKNSWQPVLTGTPSSQPVSGNIEFHNINNESHHYLLDSVATESQFYYVPEKLSFNWSVDKPTEAFKLYLGNADFTWFNLRQYQKNIFVEIQFDESEIISAFRKLDADNQPLKLEINIQAIDSVGASLSLNISNTNSSESLSHFKYVAKPQINSKDDESLVAGFEKRKLYIEYKRAINNSQYLKDYLDLSYELASNSPYVKQYALQYANYATKLIINRIKAADYNNAELVFTHYVNRLLPIYGAHKKTEDVASNALVLSILTNNTQISGLVFSKLLKDDFDVTALTNEILLYNLACYYSLHKKKQDLLITLKLAIQNGKKAEQFLEDSDFKNYWKDPDFLEIINSY